jgi:hypothetical protein
MLRYFVAQKPPRIGTFNRAKFFVHGRVGHFGLWSFIQRDIYCYPLLHHHSRCHSIKFAWLARAPRQLFTGWVAHSRPNGYPEMTWGRASKKARRCKGLQVNYFKEWSSIAEDRSEWRSRTYLKPMPPSDPYLILQGSWELKDEHCITQKETQPN